MDQTLVIRRTGEIDREQIVKMLRRQTAERFDRRSRTINCWL